MASTRRPQHLHDAFRYVETLEDRLDHLTQLRALQDETGGFTGFIPLPYQPKNNAIPVSHPPTGNDALRIAVSNCSSITSITSPPTG